MFLLHTYLVCLFDFYIAVVWIYKCYLTVLILVKTSLITFLSRAVDTSLKIKILLTALQEFAHPTSQTIILILLFFIYVVINLWSLIPNICWNILKLLAICYFWTPTIFVVYCIISITVQLFLLLARLQWLNFYQGIILNSCYNSLQYNFCDLPFFLLWNIHIPVWYTGNNSMSF